MIIVEKIVKFIRVFKKDAFKRLFWTQEEIDRIHSEAVEIQARLKWNEGTHILICPNCKTRLFKIKGPLIKDITVLTASLFTPFNSDIPQPVDGQDFNCPDIKNRLANAVN